MNQERALLYNRIITKRRYGTLGADIWLSIFSDLYQNKFYEEAKQYIGKYEYEGKTIFSRLLSGNTEYDYIYTKCCFDKNIEPNNEELLSWIYQDDIKKIQFALEYYTQDRGKRERFISIVKPTIKRGLVKSLEMCKLLWFVNGTEHVFTYVYTNPDPEILDFYFTNCNYFIQETDYNPKDHRINNLASEIVKVYIKHNKHLDIFALCPVESQILLLEHGINPKQEEVDKIEFKTAEQLEYLFNKVNMTTNTCLLSIQETFLREFLGSIERQDYLVKTLQKYHIQEHKFKTFIGKPLYSTACKKQYEEKRTELDHSKRLYNKTYPLRESPLYISSFTYLYKLNDRTDLLFKNDLCLEDIETVIDFGNPEYITKMLNKNFTLSKEQIILLQNKALELKNKNLILHMIDNKIRFPMKYAIELVEYDIVNKLLEAGYDLTEKDYNGEDISSLFHREDASLPKKKIFNLIKEQYEKQTGLSNSDTQSITSLQIENAMLRSENMGLKHTIEMLKHQLIAQSVSRK